MIGQLLEVNFSPLVQYFVESLIQKISNPFSNSSKTHEDRVVDNKAKGRISKQVLIENKARQVFRKTNISYPLIRTRICAYQGVRNVRFSEYLACFFFLVTPVLRFALLPYSDELTAESCQLR